MNVNARATGERASSARSRRLWLSLILILAAAARIFRLDWGLPEYEFQDSFKYFTEPAARVARGDLVLREYLHPPLQIYITALLDLVWSTVTGQAIPYALKRSPEIFHELTMIGRLLTVAFAVASVGVLYLLTRRLAGTRAALFAAVAFALSPLHVLESHRINPDGPATFWGLVAAHLAVIAADRRSRRHLYAAFAFAGAAAATKYTGLAAVTVPVWVALRWSQSTLTQRLRLCAVGGLATAAVLAFMLAPVVFHPDGLMKALVFQFRTGFRGDMVLSIADWASSSYGRFFAALLPYAMGWSVYLLALIGIGVAAVGNRRALAIIAAAGVPFLLVQGGSYLAPARWVQPIVPYFCLCAGIAMDRLWKHWPAVGIPMVALALGYTGMVTASQALRIGLAPQRALSAWMTEQASRHPAGSRVVVAYPSALLGQFDPLEPMLRKIPVDVVYSDVMLRAQASQALGAAPRGAKKVEPAGAPPEFQRDWLENLDVAFIILPSMVESHIPLKLGQHVFYERVVDGSLGFDLAEEFRTHFLTESLYVWADQSLDSHMAAGIVGYKVYARTGDDSTGGIANTP